jgi:hypothetical protein
VWAVRNIHQGSGPTTTPAGRMSELTIENSKMNLLIGSV